MPRVYGFLSKGKPAKLKKTLNVTFQYETKVTGSFLALGLVTKFSNHYAEFTFAQALRKTQL